MPCLIQKASRCAADRMPKTATFFIFHFLQNTKILLENYVFIIFFHWFSGENCMFLLSFHKGRQTSKELKRNMNRGAIVFLMSLLVVILQNFLRTLF